MSSIKRIPYKRLAFSLSILLLVVWGVLGTGASLAWFNDDSAEVKNVFNVADFKLDISYRLEDGNYAPIDGKTDIFDKEALYEPGYTQVVVLRIQNNGDMDFNYQTAVYIHSYVPGINVFGQSFLLQDHLKMGMVSADTEVALDALVATREQAAAVASKPLQDSYSDMAMLPAGAEAYMALVLRMPGHVTNIANYGQNKQPQVDLGISICASQVK